MIGTRLIFVDGLSGSGKSTTAHWLARQLAHNGVEADWHHEEEEGHPLAFIQPPDLEGVSDSERRERCMRDLPGQWKAWAGARAGRGGVTVVEGHLLMCQLMPLIRLEFPRDRIEAFLLSLWQALAVLDPVLIALHQDDVPAAFRLNWKRRGKEWEDWYVGRLAGSDYARKRGIGGAEAAFSIGADFMEILRSFASRVPGPRLLLETGAQD